MKQILAHSGWALVVLFALVRWGQASAARDLAVLRATELADKVLADSTTHQSAMAAANRIVDSMKRRLTVSVGVAARRSQENVALRGRIGALLAAGDTAGAQVARDSLTVAVEAENVSLRDAVGTCQAIVQVRDTQLQGCSLRVDSLTAALRGLTVSTRARLKFSLGLFSLPRPPKWLAAVSGCGLGAWLDGNDRLRGCGLGAASTQYVVPSR